MSNRAPRICRVDGKEVKNDELISRRFTITIKSVHYFIEDGSSNCAGLLKTEFVLQGKDKLAYALVPLHARPLPVEKESAVPSSIDIIAYHPCDPEYANILTTIDSNEVVMSPHESLNVAGTGAELKGLGSKDQTNVHTISLSPVCHELNGRPTYLDWVYKDPKGVYYPEAVDVLVIVTRGPKTDELSFPFQLVLGGNLKVDIHQNGLQRTMSMLAITEKKHEGWFFKIREPYEPSVCEKVLKSVRAKEQSAGPPEVGLQDALKQWLTALCPGQ
ncbi:hypothetical protein C8J56DRAFT_1048463 [Mycena floridula]|nr:hypothetical protein C8J56DRAFT_1048463 [Mycena floridula]